jgi:hypothetical protein
MSPRPTYPPCDIDSDIAMSHVRVRDIELSTRARTFEGVREFVACERSRERSFVAHPRNNLASCACDIANVRHYVRVERNP